MAVEVHHRTAAGSPVHAQDYEHVVAGQRAAGADVEPEPLLDVRRDGEEGQAVEAEGPLALLRADERRPLRVHVDRPERRVCLDELLGGPQHHPRVVQAAVLGPDHLHPQRVADLPQRGGPHPADARGGHVGLRGLAEVHVAPEDGRHLEAVGLAVSREHQLQVGAAVRHCAARPPRDTVCGEGRAEGVQRFLERAGAVEPLLRDAGERRAELRDLRPLVLAVVLPVARDLPGPGVVDREGELDDLPLVAEDLAVLALVAGPLKIQADPQVGDR
mmetsp:Transcript_14211/g.40430  ORF Transcript_14211/g.40430 Transcript_14211/m.40430 type:complete len:274 (+) Transcript_14211:666-1487(+)